jgi:hypothetical protein
LFPGAAYSANHAAVLASTASSIEGGVKVLPPLGDEAAGGWRLGAGGWRLELEAGDEAAKILPAASAAEAHMPGLAGSQHEPTCPIATPYQP